MQDPHHELAASIRDELKQAHKVLVISHQRPDGDAIGSVLAMGLALRAQGKEVQTS